MLFTTSVAVILRSLWLVDASGLGHRCHPQLWAAGKRRPVASILCKLKPQKRIWQLSELKKMCSDLPTHILCLHWPPYAETFASQKDMLHHTCTGRSYVTIRLTITYIHGEETCCGMLAQLPLTVFMKKARHWCCRHVLNDGWPYGRSKHLRQKSEARYLEMKFVMWWQRHERWQS